MPIPRPQPSVLQTICFRQCTHTQIRCLRTTPNRVLPPRQSAFGGIPVPSIAAIQKQVQKRMRRKGDSEKIPIVPKVGDDGQLVKEAEKPSVKPKKSKSEMTEDELEEVTKVEEEERRIKAFEEEQRALKGKSEVDKERIAARERGMETIEEKPDNIVYPRDVIGRRFRKERVKYKVDVY